ncbi:ExeM/NucH family extracellular endonuclease [Albibacillus kandeliae]|uniref:ExeM/NucH family extracellular endonuclease n=1 Tax=Albibacillus kandeliae TaxID=2174228 RepID=UPI000D69DCDA|nr:ExeM/NucH family extracellular endonuclease [Albibacillus kandeliae]
MYLGFDRAVGRQNNSFEPKLILGSNRSDTIEGNSRDNVILGLKGDDTIFGGDGSDKIIGGRGFDTAVYSGSILDYRIDGFGFAKGCKTSPLALMVTGVGASADIGRDVLTGIEALYFEGDDYTLYLDGRNNAVLAGDDAVAAVEGTALMIDTAELLANDHEFDGDTLVITAVSATSELGASLSLENNQITYLAGASFDALAEGEQVTDTFTYIVDDGKGGTDTATVTVTLTGTNDAPDLTVASDVTIDENTTAVTTASATDVDSSTLVYALSGDDAHLFQIDEDGNLSFIAAPDFESPEDADADNRYQVTVTVTDDLGASDSTDLTVTLADVAEGPLSLKQSFETEAVGNRYEAANTNGTTLPIGTVVDLVNVDGLASVDSTEASAGLIGYDLTWENTRGDVGISDGDYIGVQNYTGAVGAFTDGSQGYELSDADGLLRLTFDTIDLSGAGKTMISLDAFVQSTGWEADDLINIYVVTDAGTVSLLDSTGQDIDNMGIEGSWMKLSTMLEASVNSAQLVVEFDSNSADEALYFDNVEVQEQFEMVQSFETESVGNRYEAADTNGTTLPIGTVVDLDNVDGLASVDSTEASAGLIGYDLTWENTRGDVGISDGDYIGVQNYTGVVGAFTDGSQGYELSDADGLLRLTFDTIDLSAVGEVTVSLDAFLQSTGWEADDLVNIYVVTDGGTVSLLDSTGQDIDDMGIEGSWMTLSATLSERVNSAQLVVEFDSNSADEALYFDNVYVGTAGEDTGEPADITLISAIQGTEGEAAMAGESVTVSAIVTHITDTGFYLQEEEADYDADARTSEGIFVYGNTSGLAVGDLVAVSGIVSDYYGMTQLSSVSNIDVLDTGVALPALSTLTLSTDTPIDYEAYEGMLVEIASATDPLTVIENYNLDRYGEIVIATGTQTQPTQLYDAQTQADEIAALTEANTNTRILLDDGSSAENPDAFVFIPDNNPDDDNGYLDSGDTFTDAGTTLRLGAELNDTVKGVLNYGFDDWRVTVTETLSIDESTNSGAREASPEDVGGSLQVASYNVLNFFTTIDQGSAGTGPDGTLDPRGADTVEEFERQAAKIVDGILGTGAEVLALQEIENNGSGDGSAVDTLADMVTAAVTDGSVFASVDPTGTGGFVGTDAITTGIIYDTTAVTLLHSEYITYEESSADTTYALAESIATAIGATDLLDDLGDYQRNRPSVAATFEDNDTGAVFTVVSSHFKSKGDSGLQAIADAAQDYLDGGGTDITQSDLDAFLSDPNFDQGDGQGFWNGVRSDAAMELAEWIGTEYNGGGVTNVIMLGDLNSYAEEDPVQYLDDTAGFTDLIDTYIGQDTAYSYVFDGQQGTLDQGMADDTLAGYVTGATEWHINADEPDLIGYDNSYTNSDFYNDGVYASSDHDPLIVGLDFNGWVTPLV